MNLLKGGMALGLATVATNQTVLADNNEKKPNILFIISDDAGYVDFGFMGSKVIKTPNLDKLASEGILFTQAYAGPTCSPSRCSLLSGSYQQRAGFGRNCGARFNVPNDGFPAGVATMPQDLKREGYTTGIIGKWHQGAVAGVNQPLDLGFDEFWGFLGGSRSYFGNSRGANALWRGRTPDPDWINRKSEIPNDPKKGRHVTDSMGDEAAGFVNKHAGDKEPFFLYLSFTAPHTPMHAKVQDKAQFPNLEGVRNTQAAMQLAMDRAVGNVIKTLDKKGIRDNTYIVFINDNGGSRHSGSNGPLRDQKGSVYEGGVRVPMIMTGPGLKAGSEYSLPVPHMDLLPTFVALAGGKVNRKIDGKNLIPYITGKNNARPHEEIFYRHTGAGVAYRHMDWKLINPKNPGERGQNKPGSWELYNLADDLSEKNNLATQKPEVVADLKQRLAQFEAKLPKNRWGRFGKQDRNYFDSFTWKSGKDGKWFDKSAWTKSTDTSKSATMSTQDLYADASLIFPLGEQAYTVSNNLYSASGLSAMVNYVHFKGTGKITLDGNALRTINTLAGKAPVIKIDKGGEVNLKLPLIVPGILSVMGEGSLSATDLCGNVISVNCDRFDLQGTVDVKKLTLSSDTFSVKTGVKISGELVVGSTTKLNITETGLKYGAVILTAGKISGSFANKEVTVGSETYLLKQSKNQIIIGKK